MEYIFDLLVDAIEIDDIAKPDPFPDLYRKYLFNKPHLVLPDNPVDRAIITNTEEKFWRWSKSKLCRYLCKLVDKDVPLTEYLNSVKTLDPKNAKYYDHVYDMCDIIISRHFESRMLVEAIKKLLDKNSTNPSHYIIPRINIYLAVRFIEIEPKKMSMKKFTDAVIGKLKEFHNDEGLVWKYFTKTELDHYIAYTKNLINKYNNDN